jgi:drug/metabolite transporter (DMT)-like permease
MEFHLLSSFLLIAISFNAVINDIIMKTLAMEGLNPLAINGLRIFFSCIIGIVMGLNKMGIKVFKNILDFPHWIRNITTIGALWAVIYGLSKANIAQIDLITYLIPAFISLISTIFFREKFNIINFILVTVCVGTFLLRKGFFNTLPLIISALLFGFAEVWIRHKMHKYNFWTMIVSLGTMGSLLLSYYFIPVFKLLTGKQWILSFLMGIGDISILGLITWKSKVGSSHDYLPLRYTSIIFALLADKFIFNNISIDYIMVSVVIGSSLISILFNKKI